MIYFNNAATSYPKPQCVRDAHAEALKNPPSGQFRSTGSFGQKDWLTECRQQLGRLLGIREWQRIYFSSGATDSFNRVWRGLEAAHIPVFATRTEHNSILRPLCNIRKESSGGEGGGIAPILLPCDERGRVEPGSLGQAAGQHCGADGCREGYRGVVVVNHCSNVTGMVQDMEEMGKICREHHLLYIADISQSAGCIPVRADDWGIDIAVFTGHKSLYGVPGTGGFYLRTGVPCRPEVYGGTGRESRRLYYGAGNEDYEVGTQNVPGIAALCQGVTYVLDRGVENIFVKERRLMKRLYEGLGAIGRVRLYGDYQTNQGPLLSFTIDGMKCGDVAYILEQAYEIRVRTGLHCAPLIHGQMGTQEDGTVRVSISDFTTEEDIDALLQAVGDIASEEL